MNSTKIVVMGCLLILLSFFSITGCEKKELTVDYLLAHPMLLEKELQACMSYEEEQSSAQAARCKLVTAAHAEIFPYLNLLQRDPEAFGQKILEVEMELAELKKAKQLNENKRKHAQVEKAYVEKQQELKRWLGAASLSGPD